MVECVNNKLAKDKLEAQFTARNKRNSNLKNIEDIHQTPIDPLIKLFTQGRNAYVPMAGPTNGYMSGTNLS